jgi:molecular chaperone GrpE
MVREEHVAMTDERDTSSDPGSSAMPDLGSDPSLAQVMERLAALELENEASKSRAIRLMADFQNYQRRAYLNEIVAKQQGMAAVVQSVVGVLDHFDMAIKQIASSASAEQVLEGVRVIRDELMKALTQHGVRLLEPKPNDPFEPGRHEAVMQQAATGIHPGCIVRTFQPGYVMGTGSDERVLRAAKVMVAPAE